MGSDRPDDFSIVCKRPLKLSFRGLSRLLLVGIIGGKEEALFVRHLALFEKMCIFAFGFAGIAQW